jgi:hypothetical protein
VRRLVRLAYPKAPARTHEDLTKDQFIEALGDGEVRWSVFQARPKNITEALKVAMELEAFKESEKCRIRRSVRGIQPEETIREETLGKQREDDPNPGVNLKQMAAQINQMSQMVPSYASMGARLKGTPGGTEPGGPRDRSAGSGGMTYGGRKEGGEGGDRSSRPPFDISRVRCYRCDKLGHYVRDCPELRKKEVPAVATELPLNE